MSSRGPGLALAALVSLFAPVLCEAAKGVVTDTTGRPLAGVHVCHYDEQGHVETLCVETDDNGAYTVIDSEELKLRVSAPGYFAQVIPATGERTIVLEQSPTLLVRLVDAKTKKPIDEAQVFVIYPGPKRKGPFPANRAGVRIARVLEPGEVRVIGSASGFEDSAAVVATLERGRETELTLELARRAAAKPKP